MIWIPGDPTKESELDKVRLAAARAVIVIGQRQLNPGQADAMSILTVFTMRSYLQKQAQTVRRSHPVYIVAEVLDGENVEHARTAASEVIESTKIGFSMLAHAICVPGASEIMSRVVVAGAHNLYVDAVPNDVVLPMTFGEMATHIKRYWNVLLIGIRMGDDDILNPPDDTPVGDACMLIYLGEGQGCKDRVSSIQRVHKEKRMARGTYFSEFEVGQDFVSGGRTVTEADVVAFAGLSGDYNPLHIDKSFAEKTPFGKRIAHGMLSVSISTGLGQTLGIFEGTTMALMG